MIMLALLAAIAVAEPVQDFPDFATDVELEGSTFEGILVSEATYAELIQLRAEVKKQEADILTFVEWKASSDKHFKDSLGAIQESCTESTHALTSHYDAALRKAARKDALQRQAFPAGLVVGAVVATVGYGISARYYQQTLAN